ncbi:Uncharacterised protein [Achromobacter sp. 2789STDY5608615]|nr:Uncharacterised protein [Achromobacter sp. 2789STDY5608615]
MTSGPLPSTTPASVRLSLPLTVTLPPRVTLLVRDALPRPLSVVPAAAVRAPLPSALLPPTTSVPPARVVPPP